MFRNKIQFGSNPQKLLVKYRKKYNTSKTYVTTSSINKYLHLIFIVYVHYDNFSLDQQFI